MKKNLLKLAMVIVAMLGATQWATAAEFINQLVIKCANGDSYYIALDETPKVFLTEDELTVMYSGQKIYLDATDTVDFTWGNAAGIEDLKVNTKPTFYWDGDVLHVLNLQPEENVALYSIDGKVLYSGRADMEGTAEISLAGRTGVAIVKTQSQTIKFSR
ncbi:MAG: hypothetical protein LIP09_09045 [Bacteroidales bacterium]|nr:hypothetical protein [Bacteroidales bacterium]